VTEVVTVETCTPGFTGQTCVQETKAQPVIGEDGRIVTQTSFVGWSNYANVIEPARAWAAITSGDFGTFLAIDFWRALRFTLSFTFITLPLVLMVGLGLALAVNALTRSVRGPVIFVTLLPFIITPVIGALAIRWLFVGDGILTRLMEHWSGAEISMFAQGWTIEILMMFYRVWHVAPFAFIIFYAGLQSVNQDAVEAALIDGATRWQRLRYVVIPHLMPLIVFVALIHLMDAYRVFEEVIGFRSEAYVISLQYLTYDFLTPDGTGTRAVNRASASSMLTMIGIVILLIPLLRHTWRQHRGTR
jgi:multiple sugar transport system permease protein